MPELNIDKFYKISELDRASIQKQCKHMGISEEDFIKLEMKTTRYAFQEFYYYLDIFVECLIKEFKTRESKIFIIFWVVGLILILSFVKN